MSTSSWQVQHTLALRWGHGNQLLLSVKTRPEAIGAKLPKVTQWLWNLLITQKTSSRVLPGCRFRPTSLLLHQNGTTTNKAVLWAEPWRNSRPGFCFLRAYLFIWKYHCKSSSSRAGGDADLQNCWCLPPHWCQPFSCMRCSLGPGAGRAAYAGVTLLGQGAQSQPCLQVLCSPKCPLHMGHILTTELQVMWMCNSTHFYGSFRKYQRGMWRCKNPHISIYSISPIFHWLSLCKSPLADF